jgi:hypothetical protein
MSLTPAQKAARLYLSETLGKKAKIPVEDWTNFTKLEDLCVDSYQGVSRFVQDFEFLGELVDHIANGIEERF